MRRGRRLSDLNVDHRRPPPPARHVLQHQQEAAVGGGVRAVQDGQDGEQGRVGGGPGGRGEGGRAPRARGGRGRGPGQPVGGQKGRDVGVEGELAGAAGAGLWGGAGWGRWVGARKERDEKNKHPPWGPFFSLYLPAAACRTVPRRPPASPPCRLVKRGGGEGTTRQQGGHEGYPGRNKPLHSPPPPLSCSLSNKCPATWYVHARSCRPATVTAGGSDGGAGPAAAGGGESVRAAGGDGGSRSTAEAATEAMTTSAGGAGVPGNKNGFYGCDTTFFVNTAHPPALFLPPPHPPHFSHLMSTSRWYASTSAGGHRVPSAAPLPPHAPSRD